MPMELSIIWLPLSTAVMFEAAVASSSWLIPRR